MAYIRQHCALLLLALTGHATRLTRLPLDISTFATLRTHGYTYIDKTRYAYQLLTTGKRFFFARPRRFGKSLFLATLHEILNNNRPLFEGLWIDTSDYTWPTYGVINLDLSALGVDDVYTLKAGLIHALKRVAHRYGIDLDTTGNPELILYDLVTALRDRFGKVALLVDEYDAPLLSLIEQPQTGKSVRDALRRFFAAVKSMDALIDFVCIAGVTSCAHTTLFSGMNNLRTITFAPAYAGMCGYTREEIARYLSTYITTWAAHTNQSLDTLSEHLWSWYGGYRFSADHTTGNSLVCNPYSLMHALEDQRCEPFWMYSGAPSFLIDSLRHALSTPAGALVTDLLATGHTTCSLHSLSLFDIDTLSVPALLYQTGYLTLAPRAEGVDNNVQLIFPNTEIAQGMRSCLLALCTPPDLADTEYIASALRTALTQENLPAVVQALRLLFAHIPYQLHMPEEKFYHAVMQAACTVAGLDAQSEYATSHGRADLVITLPDMIYIFEMKAKAHSDIALQQIKDRRYYDLFVHLGKPIYLVGLSFWRHPSALDITYSAERITPPEYVTVG